MTSLTVDTPTPSSRAEQPGAEAPLRLAIVAAIDAACARIAPAWPLDRLIAVNPYWGFVDRPIEDAAAHLTALSGTRLTMARSGFRARFAAGEFAERHLLAAMAAKLVTRFGRGPARERPGAVARRCPRRAREAGAGRRPLPVHGRLAGRAPRPRPRALLR